MARGGGGGGGASALRASVAAAEGIEAAVALDADETDGSAAIATAGDGGLLRVWRVRPAGAAVTITCISHTSAARLQLREGGIDGVAVGSDAEQPVSRQFCGLLLLPADGDQGDGGGAGAHGRSARAGVTLRRARVRRCVSAPCRATRRSPS